MWVPLAEVSAAHRRLQAVIAGLSDDLILGPSRLPGWTRGHVLAHVSDAARARTRVVEGALRGEHVDMWEPGERDRNIDANAGNSAAEHRAAIAETAAGLEQVWTTVTDWTRFAGAVFTRWREVQIHLVDLDLGFEPADWELPFTAHVLDLFSQRLPADYSVHAVDLGQTWGTGNRVIEAPARDLASWLVGRASTVTGPDLGGWPTY